MRCLIELPLMIELIVLNQIMSVAVRWGSPWGHIIKKNPSNRVLLDGSCLSSFWTLQERFTPLETDAFLTLHQAARNICTLVRKDAVQKSKLSSFHFTSLATDQSQTYAPLGSSLFSRSGVDHQNSPCNSIFLDRDGSRNSWICACINKPVGD